VLDDAGRMFRSVLGRFIGGEQEQEKR
jgi:hypothetical protein